MDIRDGFVGTVGNTPLIKLRRASEATGCTILGKAEFLNPGGSVKDRAALYIIKDAEERGLLKPGGVVVEGTAGNTGIGLALVGNARGYRTVIVMPETQSQEKKDMLLLCGVDLQARPGRALCQPEQLRALFRPPRRGDRRAGAERRDLGQPVRQPRQPPRPSTRRPAPKSGTQTDGKVDGFTCSVGTGGTLVRRRHCAERAQPGGKNLPVRPDGVRHLQLVRAPRVQAGGQLDHRGDRQQPRDQKPRRLHAGRPIPDQR